MTANSKKGNKNITWETNTNINLGIEFELLKGRLSGSIEYFNRRTTDMLNRFSVPLSLGYSGYYDNIGDMNNKGVEIDLKYIPVKTRNVTWNIGFNATHYRNKISRLAESKKTDIIDGHAGYVTVCIITEKDFQCILTMFKNMQVCPKKANHNGIIQISKPVR